MKHLLKFHSRKVIQVRYKNNNGRLQDKKIGQREPHEILGVIQSPQEGHQHLSDY